MTYADFVHLRVHSAYSLSEGAIHIKDLVELCRDAKMPAVAVADTSNIFGALEFSGAAAKAGVQPIIGCQLRIVETEDDNGGTMVFLAKDDAGYRNLLKLLSQAYLKSEDTHDPHVPFSVLSKHAEGLIALSGGPSGPVGRLLLEGQADKAKN